MADERNEVGQASTGRRPHGAARAVLAVVVAACVLVAVLVASGVDVLAPLRSAGLLQTVATEESAGAGDGAAPAAAAEGEVAASVTIDASLADAGSRTVEVGLESGATAYDALVATGADVRASDTSYGIYVQAVDGVADDSSHGWVYSVNGEEPSVSASDYEVSDGDAVCWTYVEYTL